MMRDADDGADDDDQPTKINPTHPGQRNPENPNQFKYLKKKHVWRPDEVLLELSSSGQYWKARGSPAKQLLETVLSPLNVMRLCFQHRTHGMNTLSTAKNKRQDDLLGSKVQLGQLH